MDKNQHCFEGDIFIKTDRWRERSFIDKKVKCVKTYITWMLKAQVIQTWSQRIDLILVLRAIHNFSTNYI